MKTKYLLASFIVAMGISFSSCATRVHVKRFLRDKQKRSLVKNQLSDTLQDITNNLKVELSENNR